MAYESKHTIDDLKQRQSLPLDGKILMTQRRIFDFYNHYNGNVAVSFSGGKDSTVLLHIARRICPDIKAVFCNTGLEYPEIQAFVRKQKDVDIIRPEMGFKDVLTKYGYPLISKEVAEAIWYARRIIPDSAPGGPTKKMKRSELSGDRKYLVGTSTPNREPKLPLRRRVLMGKWITDNTPESSKPEENSSKTTGNVQTQTSMKSFFNKEKWLPLCQDAPFMIASQCCSVMKKSPINKWMRRHDHSYPILATMADESRLRRYAWLKHGCNAFDTSHPVSTPMAFWTQQDVLEYIVKHSLEIAPVYGDIVAVDRNGNEYYPLPGMKCCTLKCSGCQRTGCIFCAFGAHFDKGKSRFQLLAETHPRQYEYCMRGGQWIDNPAYDPTIGKEPDATGWVNWNPKKIWVPSDEGLGMRYVFETVNSIYGKNLIRFE